MRRVLEGYCEYTEDPRLDFRPVVIRGHPLPASYLEILRIANGFALHRRTFRFFGIETRDATLDLCSWNQSSWVAEYGDLANNIIFLAEDIFGDQYGLRYTDGTPGNFELIKFWCEGGETQVVEAESIEAWLVSCVLRETPTVWDVALANAVLARGLVPSETEHLAFSVPLIVGGNSEQSNLEVMDREFHLHLLGQLSRKNRSLQEGARINRFWSES